MNLDLKEITFIIVTYKAKKIIYNCINSLPKFSKKIVVENSYDRELKSDLESKYDNIEVILNENQGMGASNNIGIKKATTKYAFVINPDVVFKENTFLNLVEEVKNIDNFSIISPINTDKNFPNYKIQNNYPIINDHIVEVDTIDGFSMLINKSKFADQTYFDENFFLYLENTDLCLRQKNKKEKIFIIKNSEIKHIGSYTTKLDLSNNLEYIRNWHWMWSKFYFNRRHKNYIYAFLITFPNFISSLIKLIIFMTLNNKKKFEKYKMRFNGLLSAYLKKKSFYRPYDKN